ncbi:hypothetical protein BIY24_04045 [Halobacteriovorax marinus]|uniref:glutathione peroxidase n=1 Tax=Halobacteriovorax marinus TaxID=97084 RepID=UPI000BC33A56|nr:glutathione peroxidase [Halobacteriovorax marinus]ATH07136.1 hypothetical protein BIY24_04045 [Halobacteriovorax marinus]
MKLLTLIIAFFTITSTLAKSSELHAFKLKAPRKNEINLEKYKDGPLLIINIATRCGYTGQLDDIEKLYKKYSSKGLVIIGIPSNDFGGQTPESNQEVVEMCRVKYGASFPISTKVKVLGKEKHPLIEYMISESKQGDIKWNFEKFLFDKTGKFIKRFDSKTLPLNSELEEEIKKIL